MCPFSTLKCKTIFFLLLFKIKINKSFVVLCKKEISRFRLGLVSLQLNDRYFAHARKNEDFPRLRLCVAADILRTRVCILQYIT